MEQSGRGESVLVESVTRVRDAARWLIGSFGAIGAVLAAGIPLSNLGSLAGPRLWIASVVAVAGLLSVLAAIWLVLEIILPSEVTLGALAARSESRTASAVKDELLQFLEDENSQMFKGLADRIGGDRGLATRWEEAIAEYRRALEEHQARPGDRGLEAAAQSAGSRMRMFGDVIAQVLAAASYRQLRLQIQKRQWWIFLSIAFAGASLVTFSAMANPDSPLSPSLRGTDLSGSDLRGAVLEEVDLRAANLSGSDLRGANLNGARIDGTEWEDVRCPDGTLSAYVRDAKGEFGTCDGHLAP